MTFLNGLKTRSKAVIAFLLSICMLACLMTGFHALAEETVDLNIYSCGGEILVTQDGHGDTNHYYLSVPKGGTAYVYFNVIPPEGKIYDGVFSERDGKGNLITENSVYCSGLDTAGDGRTTIGYGVTFDLDINENTDLYINWVDPITVTLDANGGYLKTKEGNVTQLNLKFTPNRRNHIQLDEYHYNSESSVVRDNYRFDYWSTEKDADNGYFFSDLIFTEDTTIYAVWKPIEYEVTIINGQFNIRGNDTAYQKTVEKGETAALSFTLYDYYNKLEPGKFFGGIYTAPSGTGKQVVNECIYNADDGTYRVEAEYIPSEDITLYIHWASGISLTLDANGGSFKDGETVHYQKRAANVIWKEFRNDNTYHIPSRKGYEFKGWSLNSDATNGFSLDDYLANDSTTLFAIWEESNEPHVHSEEIIIGKDATCTEDGLTEGIICSLCGEIIREQQVIKAKGHDIVNIEAVEPTCTAPGATKGSHCTVCGEVFEAVTEIPALGHIEEEIPAVPATCKEDGLTSGVVCSVCGEVIVGQDLIPAKGHQEVTVNGKAATCTEDGLTDGKKCSVCGDVLKEQEKIPALGHEYKDGTCTRCGAKDPNYIAPDEKLNGVLKGPDGKWGYYKNDVLQEKYTGFQKNEYGYWYIVNGYVDFDRNDILRDGENGWWKVDGGKVNFNYTGVAKNKYGWWRVENGLVNFNAQGIYKNDYGWWKTTDGKVTFKENGVFKNEYGWWKVEDSKVNFKYTGVAKNEYGWWRIEKGKVNFKFTGIAKNEYGSWYINKGKVDFTKNGKVKYDGKVYKVTNGKAKLA